MPAYNWIKFVCMSSLYNIINWQRHFFFSLNAELYKGKWLEARAFICDADFIAENRLEFAYGNAIRNTIVGHCSYAL